MTQFFNQSSPIVTEKNQTNERLQALEETVVLLADSNDKLHEKLLRVKGKSKLYLRMNLVFTLLTVVTAWWILRAYL